MYVGAYISAYSYGRTAIGGDGYGTQAIRTLNILYIILNSGTKACLIHVIQIKFKWILRSARIVYANNLKFRQQYQLHQYIRIKLSENERTASHTTRILCNNTYNGTQTHSMLIIMESGLDSILLV